MPINRRFPAINAQVWGLAALAILLSGLAAGWLFGGVRVLSMTRASSLDGAALLARQDAINQQLRERIAGLERALSGLMPAHRQR